jgi:hypothetical protein
MFVRFLQSPRRLQLSLVETRRENGRVCRSADSQPWIGIAAADAAHVINMSLLTPGQFERFLELNRRQSDLQRRDYTQLRRFLRAETRRWRGARDPHTRNRLASSHSDRARSDV